MKQALIYLFIICAFKNTFAQQCPIVPFPNHYESKEEQFNVNRQTSIVVDDPQLQSHAYFLQKELLKATGLTLSIHSSKNVPSIILSKGKGKEDIAGEYKLHITPREIKIVSKSDEGIFYGLISLLQIIRAEKANKSSVNINCLNINDSPRFSWRGIMLDESRHFFGKETVKFILDWMAFYKLNRFHWHLTDSPGWRLEIKQYPNLNLVGGIGSHSNPYAPATYYTQEDITEIISYASERYITVIPEIDMPGHAAAANKAYPEYSGGGSERYPEFTFNPGKEDTYQYLTSILSETDALFPSQMIHLGGDEVHFGNENWNKDHHIQQLMQDKKLNDLKSVEQYFIQRMADSLSKFNNKALLWDEAASSSLDPDSTIIFWWRHDRPDQLKLAFDKGYSTVLCPRLPFYFDFVQHDTQRVGRRWKEDKFNSLDNVYNFSLDTLPKPKNHHLILGIQAALWSEQISTVQKLEYMLFPRICALAENAWTKDENRNYSEFSKRLESHLKLFKDEKIYYYNPNAPHEYPEPIVVSDKK